MRGQRLIKRTITVENLITITDLLTYEAIQVIFDDPQRADSIRVAWIKSEYSLAIDKPSQNAPFPYERVHVELMSNIR